MSNGDHVNVSIDQVAGLHPLNTGLEVWYVCDQVAEGDGVLTPEQYEEVARRLRVLADGRAGKGPDRIV